MRSLRIANYLLWLTLVMGIATSVISNNIPRRYLPLAPVLLVVSLILWGWLNARQAAAERVLDGWADQLAKAVKRQWDREAKLRRLTAQPRLPVRWQLTTRNVPKKFKSAVDGQKNFSPLAGVQRVTQEILANGGGLDELHTLYGGLGSGRLILTGEPAAGKTTAAVLLLRAALEHRKNGGSEHAARVPVPVLFDLVGWNPNDEDPTRWLVGRLARRYSMFRGRVGRAAAEELLEEGRISVFLDGFDQVQKSLRPVIMSALSDANYRIVLISRAHEASTTLQKVPQGSGVMVELRAVDSSDAVAYLLHDRPEPVPPAWAAVTANLAGEPQGRLATALANPLFVSLTNEVYDNAGNDRSVDELLDRNRFPTPLAVQRHLLDEIVWSAYRPRPRQPAPPFSIDQATHTLRLLARRLDQQENKSLRWWTIPSWVTSRRAPLIVATAAAVFQTIVGFILLPPVMELRYAAITSIGLGANVFQRLSSKSTTSGDDDALTTAGWRDIFPPRAVPVGFVVWSLSGPGSVLLTQSGVLGNDPPPPWVLYTGALTLTFGAILITGRGYQMVSGTIIGVGAGPSFDPIRDGNGPAEMEVRTLDPREVWRHHLGLRLGLGILVGLAVGLFVGGSTGSVDGLRAGLAVGATFALMAAITAALARNVGVATAFAMVDLARTEGTPLRLMAFLEDARRRNILRAVGPRYEFRHDMLLKRFVEVQSRKSGKPAPTAQQK
ncbi:hypothetical protein [Micromonospora halophytica]|uniref:NACHT domain-containing protein n=1 Tax=Micromonospora halophytica TaxID=47864 RepID=A0A1C5JKY3_9ACTN|nr:hypothetical protein [Micromonospora halophytica]SCG71274.1 hypothetical protein GA0070560_14019 [Micromonospora halophytica]